MKRIMKRKRIDYEVEESVKFEYLYNSKNMTHLMKNDFKLFKKVIQTYKNIFLKTKELKLFLIENINLKIAKLLVKYDHDLNIKINGKLLIGEIIENYNNYKSVETKNLLILFLKQKDLNNIIIFSKVSDYDFWCNLYINIHGQFKSNNDIHINKKILKLLFKYNKINLNSNWYDERILEYLIKYSKKYNWWTSYILKHYKQFNKFKISKYYLNIKN